ncbi:MAG: hypothetical protein CM1200mP40_11670 [Gammaproteobacteria bacterium]|nr:MAG: hypothetical protein CM1200mP40_11670 [Gammaproteobacteria bacterium]
MSDAQEASRDLRPIREEMQTSNRVLRNGMVNLSVDIEDELEGQIEEFAQQLLALNPANMNSPSDQLAQAARDAEDLREQVEDLQQQALAFNEDGRPSGGVPTVREMRDQLQRSQQLAQNLQRQFSNKPGGWTTAWRPAVQWQQQGGSRVRQMQQGGNSRSEGSRSESGSCWYRWPSY